MDEKPYQASESVKFIRKAGCLSLLLLYFALLFGVTSVAAVVIFDPSRDVLRFARVLACISAVCYIAAYYYQRRIPAPPLS